MTNRDELVVTGARGVNAAPIPRRLPHWLWFNVGALTCLWCLFSVVGERWWPVAYLLYVPWPLWALPLLVLVPRRRAGRWYPVVTRWSLVPMVLAGLVLLGPIGGARWSWQTNATAPTRLDDGPRRLRVFSQNVHGFPNFDEFVRDLANAQPDLILLQEATGQSAHVWGNVAPAYEWRVVGEHVFGSRFPVTRVSDHWRLGYVRFAVDVAGKLMDVVSVHPPSPRFAVRHVLGLAAEGPREWATMTRPAVLAHDWQRRVNTLVAVRRELDGARPAIVAGDTNFTHAGWALRHYLAELTDAFDAVGRGFGYTFPARAPWLRLDRVMVTEHLHVVAMRHTNGVESDHRGLVVDLQW